MCAAECRPGSEAALHHGEGGPDHVLALGCRDSSQRPVEQQVRQAVHHRPGGMLGARPALRWESPDLDQLVEARGQQRVGIVARKRLVGGLTVLRGPGEGGAEPARLGDRELDVRPADGFETALGPAGPAPVPVPRGSAPSSGAPAPPCSARSPRPAGPRGPRSAGTRRCATPRRAGTRPGARPRRDHPRGPAPSPRRPASRAGCRGGTAGAPRPLHVDSVHINWHARQCWQCQHRALERS